MPFKATKFVIFSKIKKCSLKGEKKELHKILIKLVFNTILIWVWQRGNSWASITYKIFKWIILSPCRNLRGPPISRRLIKYPSGRDITTMPCVWHSSAQPYLLFSALHMYMKYPNSFCIMNFELYSLPLFKLCLPQLFYIIFPGRGSEAYFL